MPRYFTGTAEIKSADCAILMKTFRMEVAGSVGVDKDDPLVIATASTSLLPFQWPRELTLGLVGRARPIRDPMSCTGLIQQVQDKARDGHWRQGTPQGTA